MLNVFENRHLIEKKLKEMRWKFVATLVKSSENFQVLIPSGIAAVIEIWKVTVAFKIRIDFGQSFFSIPRIKFSTDISASEKETKQVRDKIVVSNKWVVRT